MIMLLKELRIMLIVTRFSLSKMIESYLDSRKFIEAT